MIELTNSQRRCLGLEEIPESWDIMELESNLPMIHKIEEELKE